MKVINFKLLQRIILSAMMFGLFINSQAQPNTTFSQEEMAQKVRDLSGMKWKFKMMLPGEGVKKGLDKIPSEDIETLVWNSARVPGDVYTDLWKAGVIEPLKIKTQAVSSASEVAVMILRIDDVIASGPIEAPHQSMDREL